QGNFDRGARGGDQLLTQDWNRFHLERFTDRRGEFRVQDGLTVFRFSIASNDRPLTNTRDSSGFDPLQRPLGEKTSEILAIVNELAEVFVVSPHQGISNHRHQRNAANGLRQGLSTLNQYVFDYGDRLSDVQRRYPRLSFQPLLGKYRDGPGPCQGLPFSGASGRILA